MRISITGGAAQAFLAAQAGRQVLWLPVLFGAGVGLYFALLEEPGWPVGPMCLAACVCLSLLTWRRRPGWLGVALIPSAIAAGFAAAQVRTALVAAPLLEREMTVVFLEGRILEVEQRDEGLRLWIAPEALGDLDLERLPAKLRIWVDPDDFYPGRWIRGRVIVRPPPGPVIPGGFDFARQAYFEQLGGVGFLIGKAQLSRRPSGTDLALFWPRARKSIGDRLQSALTGETGAVARALVTGERGAIPEAIIESMRDAGLAHLLAISGLHLGLVTGTVFFAVRALLAAIPRLALSYPIKKWAATAAMLAGAGYLLLVGVTVPAQRAFIMAGLVFIAVLFDRSPFSLRLVAVGAFFVMLLQPESLLSASFQMSFAAVTALVAAFEAGAGRLILSERRANNPILQIALYLAVVAVTSVIAILATSPFAILQFNRLALFGLAANLIAVPATALIIMPALLLALILMPIGLEELPLVAAGWGIDLVLRVAGTVARWEGAVLLVPHQPAWVLPVVVLGGLWICLWRGRLRIWGLPIIIVAAFLSAVLARQPTILIGRDGETLALRDPQGGLIANTTPERSYEVEQWLRLSGREVATPWDEAPQVVLHCDVRGCIYRPAEGRLVALMTHPGAALEDCRRAELVIYRYRLWQPCGAPPFGPLVIDSRNYRAGGGQALYLESWGWRVEDVEEARGKRPWTPRSVKTQTD